jgi:hypothetical protein
VVCQESGLDLIIRSIIALSPSSMLPYCLTDQAISLSAVHVCLT